MVHKGYIKRRTIKGAVISSRYRGTDCIAEGCTLPVNTNVYYTREDRNRRYYATRVETTEFSIED